AQMGTLQRSIGVIESVMEILGYQTEEVSLESSTTLAPMKGTIVLRDVVFTYSSRLDVEVLRGVSFTVNAGQQVALVGSSGSGKSTIASLIQRFYIPTGGAVL
ncbi:MAG: ATP-binding cassette domain-containing protein, partial [Flavobacteriales bacterium]